MTTRSTWRCEAAVGVDSSGSTPAIVICGKPAKLRSMAALHDAAALCDDCWTKTQDKYKYQ